MTSVQVVLGWGRERGQVSHLEQSDRVQSLNHTEPFFAICKMGTQHPQLVVPRERETERETERDRERERERERKRDKAGRCGSAGEVWGELVYLL